MKKLNRLALTASMLSVLLCSGCKAGEPYKESYADLVVKCFSGGALILNEKVTVISVYQDDGATVLRKIDKTEIVLTVGCIIEKGAVYKDT